MGCISMRFIRSAMSETEAGARYGAALNAMADAIAVDATR
jgi:IclR family mhp operon transcriptional activator